MLTTSGFTTGKIRRWAVHSRRGWVQPVSHLASLGRLCILCYLGHLKPGGTNKCQVLQDYLGKISRQLGVWNLLSCNLKNLNLLADSTIKISLMYPTNRSSKRLSKWGIARTGHGDLRLRPLNRRWKAKTAMRKCAFAMKRLSRSAPWCKPIASIPDLKTGVRCAGVRDLAIAKVITHFMSYPDSHPDEDANQMPLQEPGTGFLRYAEGVRLCWCRRGGGSILPLPDSDPRVQVTALKLMD